MTKVLPTDSGGTNSEVTYRIISGPPGMQVDPAGNLKWTPMYSDVGVHGVCVEISDGLNEVKWYKQFNVSVD